MPASEPLLLELGTAGGSAPSLRVEWDVEALRALGASRHEPGASEVRRPWHLDREPDWERTSALRLISAAFDDGTLLAVAALRPRGAEGHDADAVGGILVSPEGEVSELHEAFISTEYGPGGRARRLGLELYKGSTDKGSTDKGSTAKGSTDKGSTATPIRIAADRTGTVEEAGEGAGREATVLTFRMQGTPGTGLHELIPAG
jgi:hypothetical protein